MEAMPAETPAGPAASAAIEPSGLAQFFRRPHAPSSTGERVASPIGQVAWAMFDFARIPFILLVTIYVFAPYFANVVVVNDPVRGQALWGDIQAIAGLIIALFAPFIGAMSDAGGRRKPWIALFALLIAIPSALLWYARPAGQGFTIVEIGALVAIASVAYEFASVFYNAMLPSIATHARIGGLSGLSLALGNVSGLLLLIFVLVAFVLPGAVHWSFIPSHPLFGINQAAHEPERLTGPISALCIFLFTLPLLIWTPDRTKRGLPLRRATIEGIRSVLRTIRGLRHYRNVATYLLARLFFNDGMTALLTFGGVYAAGTFHWGALAMTMYGITLSIFAIFGGFFGGWLDDRFGSKAALFVSVGGTLVTGVLSISMGPDRIFWFIPYDPHAPPVHSLPFFKSWPELIYVGIVVLIAIFVTASYANARTMMARIAPAERMTEFFGLFSLSGQATSFLATSSATLFTVWTASQRGGMIAVMLFLTLGLIGMLWVREERARAV
ncbi:MAG TPA: MFS transporter [Rhizomicrobium sp.]|jgi:UMF1 family MFS transporter|nr:MFS transporter [Rhizomicrobium sp.]